MKKKDDPRIIADDIKYNPIFAENNVVIIGG